ncbi:hypothetical protein ACFP2F_21405 [Hymenobacter artigasi]|uniref:Uncharacterized protein n=1 Tax=Hymenobacter artigasi TaxID=2719616 RepID=A0ABX1HRC6_9BACT|nr:hypothetical protein [Hymenobacter artigasi]NKI91826.1 hypothetical protein [Hymenobacter artigasi]
MDSETAAYYRLEETLRLHQGNEVVFVEAAVPVVEFATWLCAWWTAHQPAKSYTPNGADPDYGPLLLLAPTGGGCHRLMYSRGNTPANYKAEQANWHYAVTRFCEDVRQAVWERYHLHLERLLPPHQLSH